MPRQLEATKDVAICDKLGRADTSTISRDFRMGKPSPLAGYLHLNT